MNTNSTKTKILFFVTEDWYFFSHRLPIARAALKNGLQVLVLTRVNEHAEKIKNENFTLIPLNINRSGKNIFREFLTFISILKIYKNEKPDIVHHVAIKPVFYGSWAAKLTGVPCIVNALAGLGHIFSSKGVKAAILQKLVTAALRTALLPVNARTIFQNHDDMSVFIDKGILPRKNACLIKGSGVDTSIFTPGTECKGKAAQDFPIVLLASRMLWTKGIGDFKKAAEILIVEKGLRIKMVLVGKPDPMNPESISEELLQQWNDSDVIDWWKYRDDMPDLLKNCSVVVLPSTYGEGVPRVLIEAASAGLPLVAYDIPGCREIVKHNENGILVPPKNIKALAAAIEKLILDPSLCQQMSTKGRELVQKEFAEEHVVRKTLSIYDELFAAFPPK